MATEILIGPLRGVKRFLTSCKNIDFKVLKKRGKIYVEIHVPEEEKVVEITVKM